MIHVEGIGQDENGFHYMAMEFIEDCALSDVLKNLYQKQRQLEPVLGAHIILQVAAGLHADHLVVRMGSPSTSSTGISANILWSVDGHTDFGIAKSRGRLDETMNGQRLKGKFKYKPLHS